MRTEKYPTEECKSRRFAKYFERKPYFPPPFIFEMVEKNMLKPSEILDPNEMSHLLKPLVAPEGKSVYDIRGEWGYCSPGDGTNYVAIRKMLPGVTRAMVEWWFCWLMFDHCRYMIWSPQAHMDLVASEETRKMVLDPTIPIKDKVYNLKFQNCEDFGIGPVSMDMSHTHPEKLPFDRTMLKDFNGTVLCSATPAEVGRQIQDGLILVHVYRDTPEGLEVRTRGWMGYAVDENRKVVKVVPSNAVESPINPSKLFRHNIEEFYNFIGFLPELYAEEKDNPMDLI